MLWIALHFPRLPLEAFAQASASTEAHAVTEGGRLLVCNERAAVRNNASAATRNNESAARHFACTSDSAMCGSMRDMLIRSYAGRTMNGISHAVLFCPVRKPNEIGEKQWTEASGQSGRHLR